MKMPSLAGLLQVAAVLPGMFFVLGLFGRWHWTLDLFGHFRVQYAAGLLFCGVAFLVLRKRRSAAVALAAGLVIGVSLIPFARNPEPDPAAKRLKVVSYNVHTENSRHEEVVRFLEKEDADMVFLMEVNEAWISALRPLEARYPYRLAVPREDNFGIAFFSRRPFSGGEKAFGDYALPWVDVTFPEDGIRLVAVHTLPPSGEENSLLRNEQLRDLAAGVKDDPRTVVCGDLNLTPYSPWFGEFLQAGGLYHSAPPVSPTWLRHHPLFAIPIDHVLTGRELAVASRKVGPSLGSDHNALVVEITDARK